MNKLKILIANYARLSSIETAFNCLTGKTNFIDDDLMALDEFFINEINQELDIAKGTCRAKVDE